MSYLMQYPIEPYREKPEEWKRQEDMSKHIDQPEIKCAFEEFYKRNPEKRGQPLHLVCNCKKCRLTYL